jgi:hypothetical protein
MDSRSDIANKVWGRTYDDEAVHGPLTNPVGDFGENSYSRNTAMPSFPDFPHPGNIQGPVGFGRGESNVPSNGGRTENISVSDRFIFFVAVR